MSLRSSRLFNFIIYTLISLHAFYLYQFQGDKEKQAVPVVQLNVIRLLADLNVAVKKSEVVDMILPLFIESLEEGDASTPSILRLRVWNLCLQSMYLLM
jgi:phosphatidylinositol 4-kinase